MRRVCAFRGTAISERSAGIAFAIIRGFAGVVRYSNARLVIMRGENRRRAPLQDGCYTQGTVERGYIVTTNHSGRVKGGCQA